MLSANYWIEHTWYPTEKLEKGLKELKGFATHRMNNNNNQLDPLALPGNSSCLCCHMEASGEQMPGDKARRLPWEQVIVSESDGHMMLGVGNSLYLFFLEPENSCVTEYFFPLGFKQSAGRLS